MLRLFVVPLVIIIIQPIHVDAWGKYDLCKKGYFRTTSENSAVNSEAIFSLTQLVYITQKGKK